MSVRVLGVLSLLIGIGLVAGCSQSVQEQEASSSDPIADVQKVAFNPNEPAVTFNVPNMSCEHHCVPVVTETLQSMAGVKAVEVDLETKTARVNVDEKQFDTDGALAKLSAEGYESTLSESAN